MRKFITFSFCIFLILPSSAQTNIDSTLILYPDNIIRLTFQNNDRIKAAYYKLESAKNDFKLFESEFTQFNPLIFSPKVNANSEEKYSSEATAGMKKDFFDGSSISASFGSNHEWGKNIARGTVNFVETEVGFPLFSSSRALERIIKRTFEENELYTKNLDYVDAVRNNIRFALEQYYDLVPRIKIYEILKDYRKQLVNLLENQTISTSNAAKEQIDGEIASLNSKITGHEIVLYAQQLDMQRYMNAGDIALSQLQKIELNYNEKGYFGEYYINENTDSIFSKALINDTEFKVLGIIKKNAEEKKRLAQKGGWDIYATTGGRYNYYSMTGNSRLKGFLIADAGVKIKMNDKKILKYTIAKAQTDINAIDYTISDRRKLIQADIFQLKDALTKKKAQIINTSTSFQSWKRTYSTKKDLFLSNQENVDNFIQAFRSLVAAHESLLNLENNYLDLIRDLDYVCGVYFTVINISE